MLNMRQLKFFIALKLIFDVHMYKKSNDDYTTVLKLTNVLFIKLSTCNFQHLLKCVLVIHFPFLVINKYTLAYLL